MSEVEELLYGLGYEEKQDLLRRQTQFLTGQKKVLAVIASRLEAKKSLAEEVKNQIIAAYQPNGVEGFLEVEGFAGFNSLQFFYDTGKFLDKAFAPILTKLPRIEKNAKAIARTQEIARPGLVNLLEDTRSYVGLLQDVCEILDHGVSPFEKAVKHIYQRAIDQFKYLQKRFLNVGADDSRTYRNPWEDDEIKSGYDLARIPQIKVEFIGDNVLLTDLVLDLADQLPREHTRKQKVKGKRKPKEVKFLDEFDVDRTSRILVELANPTYQGYIKDPRAFLQKIGGIIRDYHEILSYLDPSIREFLGAQEDNPLVKMVVNNDALRITMPDPNPMIARITGINYNGIRPNEEDVRPSSQLERRYFAARRTLLEHLAAALDNVGKAPSYDQKYKIAREAVEKGIKLQEKVREALETRQTIKLKKDKKTENEFYVGTTQGFGEFVFQREAAPAVKLKDVRGKSFDTMKEHLADLADYSKYLNLYGATAPRGKIRSNIIAIGPYGCGKTEIGRAIAGDSRFIGAEVNVTDALTCFFGEFEKNIDRVWDGAQQLRRNSGDSKLVFLIMDEFDSWFNSSNGHWVDNTYQRVQKAVQIKLDGVVDYEGVIVVGMTNEPKKIPLAIYRRFKYVDIVGELDAPERADLLKMFLSNGLPLSRGFKDSYYQRWGELLEGPTGDVIGKVADDVHYEFMRKFIREHPKEGRKLNGQIRRMQLRNNGELDKPYIKRTMGQYMVVTPDWVEEKIQAKLAEPIIREQIETAKRVYAEARDVLANLHQRKDAASGSVVQDCGVQDGRTPEYQYRSTVE